MPDTEHVEGKDTRDIYIKLGKHEQRLDGHDKSIEAVGKIVSDLSSTVTLVQSHLTEQDKRHATWQAGQDAKMVPLLAMAAAFGTGDGADIPSIVTDMRAFIAHQKVVEQQRKERDLSQQEHWRELLVGLKKIRTTIMVLLPVLAIMPVLLLQYNQLNTTVRFLVFALIALLVVSYLGMPTWKLFRSWKELD